MIRRDIIYNAFLSVKKSLPRMGGGELYNKVPEIIKSSWHEAGGMPYAKGRWKEGADTRMDRKQWLAAFYTACPKKALPILSFPGARLIGKTVREVVTDGSAQALCMKAIADRYPMAAAVSSMDLSVEAEAFGAAIRYTDREVPTVAGRLVIDAASVDALTVPAVGAGRTQACLCGIREAKALITDRPVLAGVIGPFSLAGRLYDMTEIMVDCLEEPGVIHALVDKCTQFLLAYVQAFQAAGADGIIMAEPAAGLLSPPIAAAFSVPYVKRIFDALRADAFIRVYHNCGPYTMAQLEDILSLDATIYHFGDAIDLTKLQPHIPDNVLFAGNVSPSGYFCHGTPESTYEATAALLKSLGACHNYIPSSGCDIPPDSPFENIDAFFQAVAQA